jgi:hypothetical protein
LAPDAVQVYVAPGLLVTDSATVFPRHTGLGLAVIAEGAAGEDGSDKFTGPAYTPEAQPEKLLI